MWTASSDESGLGSIEPPGRYRVIDEHDGFRVEGKDRITVSVSLSSEGTTLLVTDEEDLSVDALGLYAYRSLLHCIAQRVMRSWKQPDDRPPSSWGALHTWAQTQTRKALASRVYQRWQILLMRVPEPVRLVAKAVFVATGDAQALGCEAWPELYHYPHLVGDITRYRAAASLCRLPFPLILRAGLVSKAQVVTDGGQQKRPATLYHWYTKHCEQLRPFWNQPHFRFTLDGEYALFDQDWRMPHDFCLFYLDLLSKTGERYLLLDALADDWKACYSYHGLPYRSLNRTLMNMPGGIPVALLSYLPTLHLSRPITGRVELLTLLLFAQISGLPDPARCWEFPHFAQASRDDILTSLARYAAHTGRQLRPKTVHLRSFVSFLHEYALHDYPHRGTLIGLTEHAIRWHRQVQEQVTQETMGRLGTQRSAKQPPIPLPDAPGVRWLATVGEVATEGRTMGHCLATYAESAVYGACYLFHVDYNGSSASVQVAPWGEVLQAYGPRNALNEAADYGRLVLSRWGNRLKQWERQRQKAPVARDADASIPNDDGERLL